MIKNEKLQRVWNTKARRLRMAQEKIYKLNEENKELYKQNTKLRCENEEKKDVLEEIKQLATCNTYNNASVILQKIKERCHEYEIY